MVFQQSLENIDQFLANSELDMQAIEMPLESWQDASNKQQQRQQGPRVWQHFVYV